MVYFQVSTCLNPSRKTKKNTHADRYANQIEDVCDHTTIKRHFRKEIKTSPPHRTDGQNGSEPPDWKGTPHTGASLRREYRRSGGPSWGRGAGDGSCGRATIEKEQPQGITKEREGTAGGFGTPHRAPAQPWGKNQLLKPSVSSLRTLYSCRLQPQGAGAR